jgi:hypothetical protein
MSAVVPMAALIRTHSVLTYFMLTRGQIVMPLTDARRFLGRLAA